VTSSIEHNNTCIIRIPEGGERGGAENLFEEIIFLLKKL